MEDFKEFLKLFFTLMLFWILLTLDFSFFNISIGIFLSIVIYFISYRLFFARTPYKLLIPNLIHIFKYLLFLILEIHITSFVHIKRTILKDSNPIILEVSLDTHNPFIIMLIANSITMTPGTITLEIKRNKLIVLSLTDNNTDIKTLELEMQHKFERHFK